MSFYYTDLLLEAGDLLNRAVTENDIFEIIIEYVNSALKPDLSCFYLNNKSNKNSKLLLKRGFSDAPVTLRKDSELSGFLSESKELVCLNSRKQSPFKDLLLTESMNSGMAIAIFIQNIEYGVLIINSIQPFYFKRKELFFLENLASIIRSKNPGLRSLK